MGKGIHTYCQFKRLGHKFQKIIVNFTNAQTDFSIFDNGSIRILLNLPTFQTGKKYVLFREKIEIDDKKYGSCSYSIYLR